MNLTMSQSLRIASDRAGDRRIAISATCDECADKDKSNSTPPLDSSHCYQSLPKELPSLGSMALRQVTPLIEGDTVRTLPSASTTINPDDEKA